uniref:Uncharacterized protein n=1 Tax=Graphocephala atropunctata TaxID=36148 RepID=A0A1B6KZJ3_9HEMI
MLQTLLETAKNNPFCCPVSMAQCEASTQNLVPGRTISAAAVAVNPEESCAFGSQKYFALCGLGGILSCGITHTMVVPLDLVKCRIQVDPAKYKSVFHGFKVTLKEDGTKGLAKGWAPTFFGYSLQGLCKFGLYEVFKVYYSYLLWLLVTGTVQVWAV